MIESSSTDRDEVVDAVKYLKAPDITLRVTEKCNLRCIHCFADSGSSTVNELETDEIKGIIDWAARNGSFRLGITGGEPTLREDILEIIGYARERNLWTIMVTNGFSLTEELCRGLRATGINQVDVSVDNSHAEAHDYFRGQKGSFERATRAVKTLLRHDIPTAVTSVASAWNIDDLPSLYQLARELGATSFRLDAFIAIGRGESNLALTPEQFKNVYEWVNTLHDPDTAVDGFSSQFDFLYTDKYQPDILEVTCGHKGVPLCEAGIARCSIKADGTVSPCSYFCTPEFYAGNIRENTLDEIWHESDVLKEFRQPHPYDGVCKSCEHNTVCRGGCRARAYYMGGNLYGADPYCWVASKGGKNVQES